MNLEQEHCPGVKIVSLEGATLKFYISEKEHSLQLREIRTLLGILMKACRNRNGAAIASE